MPLLVSYQCIKVTRNEEFLSRIHGGNIHLVPEELLLPLRNFPFATFGESLVIPYRNDDVSERKQLAMWPKSRSQMDSAEHDRMQNTVPGQQRLKEQKFTLYSSTPILEKTCNGNIMQFITLGEIRNPTTYLMEFTGISLEQVISEGPIRQPLQFPLSKSFQFSN